MELLGVPITNTTMIGAVMKVAEVVKLNSLNEPINKRFGRLGEKNIAAMRRAYAETVVEELAIGKGNR
jgi:pyruvate ferredoxin oxidoreductase gamma subunit